MTEGKTHMSLVVCGHVDAGKSTTTGNLLFQLGTMDPREKQKLVDEATAEGKGSFAFAYFMDKQKEERKRGVTISCTTKEFHTPNFHYTIIDAPGHRDFIKNMIKGSSQADVGLLVVPADNSFVKTISKGDKATNEVKGQTREHARLLNLLGVKQLIVGVNKMDDSSAAYKEERYQEVRNEVQRVLKEVGWRPEFIQNEVPVIPISGWAGDNLYEKSQKMDWWKGVDCTFEGDRKLHIDTLHDALDQMVMPPKRKIDAPLRMPVSGIITTIKGVSCIVTGRVEQGTIKINDEVKFVPVHSEKIPCIGSVFSMEMHHKAVEVAQPGDNLGICLKKITKENILSMQASDAIVMAPKADTLEAAGEFTAMVQILDHPGELRPGYTPVCIIRTQQTACRLKKIVNKKGRKDKKFEEVDENDKGSNCLKAGDTASVIWRPERPLVCETFDKCEGLARVAFLEGLEAVMIGRVTAVTPVSQMPKEEEKKKGK
jgi:elongation factor 1-alpha